MNISTLFLFKFSSTLFQNIEIKEVWPKQGPMSGGTVLSVSGHSLNVGSNISATLDDLPCEVNKTQSSSQRLVCITSRAGVSASTDVSTSHSLKYISSLVVTIDNAQRVLPLPFTYTPDPRVLELKPLRSPWSGGRMITVHGSYLDAVQSPQITILLHETVLNSSTCRVVSASLMECPSPPVDRSIVLAFLRDRRSSDLALDVDPLNLTSEPSAINRNHR